MDAGLSHNKRLISKSCYYPHRCYYYEGTNLRDDGGEQRGLVTAGMGEGRVFWLGQQGRCYKDEDAGAGSGRERDQHRIR